MTIYDFIFYVLSAVLIGSATAVITARNPVHAVLFLILCFFNAAGLFLLAGAEYLAMTLVIVYVGAVAVLFLFVVMMLNVNFVKLREGFWKYAPVGALVGGILLAELIVVFLGWNNVPGFTESPAPPPAQITNTHAIGQILYTDYIYAFQIAGMILLVAMIGAITLTLRQRDGVKRQKIHQQISRTREQSVEVVSVESGKGVKL